MITPDIEAFEFLNGKPDYYCVANNTGFIEYRVIGNFVKNFDCRNYPFDSYVLQATLEHKTLNSSYIVYAIDTDSSVDNGLNYVGWGVSNFKTQLQMHKLTSEVMSNFIFSIQVTRPIVNSFVKYVLPISVITLISLSTFFIEPGQYGQRITIIVTTLIAASATHLGIINGLPPTAYLTIADRIMFMVYILFLANLAFTVYLMRLVNMSKLEEAATFNRKTFRMLLLLFGALVAVQFVI
jgi:hypothetical protein